MAWKGRSAEACRLQRRWGRRCEDAEILLCPEAAAVRDFDNFIRSFPHASKRFQQGPKRSFVGGRRRSSIKEYEWLIDVDRVGIAAV